MKVDQLIRIWGAVRKGLQETIEKFDNDDLDFVAVESGYSVRQIILHIAQEERGEIQYGVTQDLDGFPAPYPDDEYPTVADCLDLLELVHGDTQSYLGGLIDGDLEREIEAGWGGSYPRFDLVWHVIEHEIHHRGELSLILGLVGKEGFDA